MYGSWDIKCKGQFFVILGHLLPFDPPNNPKNQNLHGDIIILHMCTKNNNLMRCSSWDTERDKKFLSFWVIFCHFNSPPPPNNNKNQNFENKKHNQMMYAYSDMECDRHIFCHFKPFFALFTWLLTMKIKSWRKCKKRLEILTFYTCAP